MNFPKSIRAKTAPKPTIVGSIRLRHPFGYHWWIVRVKGSIIESHYRREFGKQFTRREAASVLKLIRRHCPNAEFVPA